jgi:hypothetical protein
MGPDDLLEDINHIYQVASNPELWPELASMIERRIGSTSAQLNSGNMATGELTNGRTKSPLGDIEATLVEFALQRSLVKRPFSKQELIDFTNSLIDGKVLQAKITA